jgi:type VI secretion system ImpM family protein
VEDTSARRPGFLSRLRDGFKGDARGQEKPVRTVRVPLNAYGKLPIYKDFITSGLTEPGAREFRNWIDRGFSHLWSREEACREVEIARYLFLLKLPESEVLVAGCLWGSGDEGGLRRFPFTLFTVLPGGHRAADPLVATEHLEVLNRQADSVLRVYGPGGSLANFYRAYRGAELDLPVKSPERISREARVEFDRVPLATLAKPLFGEEAAARWPGLLSELGKSAADSGASAPPVRVPLSGVLSRARELQFWLLWLAGASPRRKLPAGMLYPAGGGPGAAAFFTRDLRPEDFFCLNPGRIAPAPPDPPAAPSAGPIAASEAPPFDAAAWERPLSSLLTS